LFEGIFHYVHHQRARTVTRVKRRVSPVSASIFRPLKDGLNARIRVLCNLCIRTGKFPIFVAFAKRLLNVCLRVSQRRRRIKRSRNYVDVSRRFTPMRSHARNFTICHERRLMRQILGPRVSFVRAAGLRRALRSSFSSFFFIIY